MVRGVASLRKETDYAMRKLRTAGEELLSLHAPEESGRLRRGIRGVILKRQELVFTVRAEDPGTGFDYVDVTRFGHRVARIYAGQRGRSLTSSIRTTAAGSPRITTGRGARSDLFRGAKALKTKYGYFASVKGYKPTRDWVEAGVEDIEELAGEQMEVIGRGVARSIARG